MDEEALQRGTCIVTDEVRGLSGSLPNHGSMGNWTFRE